MLHRDLATRNVLVQSLAADSVSDVWVKVTDFGLAREGPVYFGDAEELNTIPWRWAPPEAHFESKWTKASDVWAFGVFPRATSYCF